MNTLKARAEEKRKTGAPDPDEPESELTLLAEIRDLLAGDREGAASDRSAGPRQD
jgi:large conductance mechanosensitive channel